MRKTIFTVSRDIFFEQFTVTYMKSQFALKSLKIKSESLQNIENMDQFFALNESIENEIAHIEAQILELQTTKRKYEVKDRLNAMEYSDEDFRRRFRLSKRSVYYLHSLIKDDIEVKKTRKGFTLSAMDRILITLRYYATASYHRVSADCYGVSEASVCQIVPVVSDKIASLRSRFIRMPTREELDDRKKEFFKIANMPSIIGAMDGTLVKIQEVGGQMNKTNFFCRKQFYAINVQIICDASAKVQDIVARWPGSNHDETVFLNSRIFERFLNGEFRSNGRESLLLGDGGYASETFLAVPLRNNPNRQRTRAENLYQKAHIASRNIVERFNGQWKKRFPCLWVGMRFRNVETVQNVIVATAVLHNICKMHGDCEPPPLSANETTQFNAALQLERQVIDNEQRQRPAQPSVIRNEFLRNYYEQEALRE